MSTYLFGTMSRSQEQMTTWAFSGSGRAAGTPSAASYERTISALVPAEVLALQAFITSVCMQTTVGPGGASTVTITHPDVLKYSFLGLLALSIGLYFAGLKGAKPRGFDVIRCLIPAFAYAGWEALQPNTAINVLAPAFAGPPAQVCAVIAAVVLGIVVNLQPKTTAPTTDQADRKPFSFQNSAGHSQKRP